MAARTARRTRVVSPYFAQPNRSTPAASTPPAKRPRRTTTQQQLPSSPTSLSPPASPLPPAGEPGKTNKATTPNGTLVDCMTHSCEARLFSASAKRVKGMKGVKDTTSIVSLTAVTTSTSTETSAVTSDTNSTAATQAVTTVQKRGHSRGRGGGGRTQKGVRRLGGVPESEALNRVLSDFLQPGLRLVICGINPGVWSGARGHHYAGPGNHFWPCLSASGLVPRAADAPPLTYADDAALLAHGIGFTNMAARTTRGEADLGRAELEAGAATLREKLRQCQPAVVCFNGKGMYEKFVGHKCKQLGEQEARIEGCDAAVYVMPSTSPRSSKWPRWQAKMPFFTELAELVHRLEHK